MPHTRIPSAHDARTSLPQPLPVWAAEHYARSDLTGLTAPPRVWVRVTTCQGQQVGGCFHVGSGDYASSTAAQNAESFAEAHGADLAVMAEQIAAAEHADVLAEHADVLAELAAQGPALISYADTLTPDDPFPLRVWLCCRAEADACLYDIDADGDVMDSDEISDAWFRCDHCDAMERTDDSHSVTTGRRWSDLSRRYVTEEETWCESCSDGESFVCDDCGDRFAESLRVVIGNNDGEVCQACCEDGGYSVCDDCGNTFSHDDTHVVDGDTMVCNGCIQRGEYFYTEDGYSSEPPEDRDDDPEDDDVEDEHQGPDGVYVRQHCYSTDANDHLPNKLSAGPFLFGAELEYTGQFSSGRDLLGAMDGRAILTEDSSVSGEVITAAMHAGSLANAVHDIADALAGAHAPTSAGLHIHADRRQLSAWQWFNLARYCSRPDVADVLEAIAGRGPTEYQSFRRLGSETWADFMQTWTGTRIAHRYVGFNVTAATVEIRCWRATKTGWRAVARLMATRRLVAIGRLLPSAYPTARELADWMATDAGIARQMKREQHDPGDCWQYPEAMKAEPQAGDRGPWEQFSDDARYHARVKAAAASLAAQRIRNDHYLARMQYNNTPHGSAREHIARLRMHTTQEAITGLETEASQYRRELAAMLPPN